jgi:hypothetical protein
MVWILDDELRRVAFNGEHVMRTEFEALGIPITQVALPIGYNG